ncbi:MAG: YfhO family protein [Acidimicrobiia bacterium]|nr:YfhO family protein [Acidimicrobiia bacterium]MCY4457747.1 YfhO family protein [Acidimicrobiaceae bacterium]
MVKVFSASRLPALVAVGVVLFAFWPALFGGGSLIAGDFVYNYAAPFDFYQSEDFSLETGSTDPINIHSHWAPLADEVRSGEVGWWNPDLAGGQPTMKGGLPVFNLGYLFAPGWFAPGLVAAVRALTAIGLVYGFVRSLGLLRVSALVSGIAFAFCGFIVGWLNWPQSSVAALAPGLLWALERLLRDPKLWRAVPLGVVVAAMVWSNFPQVTIYMLLAGAIYAAFRLCAELRTAEGRRTADLRSLALCGSAAVLLAALLASPHLIGFVQYLDWSDTSYRMGNVDSSAGVKYLLTAVAPAIWGHGAFGPGWFGEVNWTEHNAYVGASVLMLGVVGMVTGLAGGDRRQRSAVAAFAVIGASGLLVAYIGGPLSVPVRELTGAASGAMTRGKILWNLGVALVAAFGVEQIVRQSSVASRWSLRRGIVVSSAVGVVGILAFVPFLGDWLDAAQAHDVLRAVLSVSVVPALCALAVTVLILARLRGWLTSAAVGWAFVAVVGFELLSFAMPVPTIVEPAEQLTATPAHAQVKELLEPGERLGGEGWTFFPSTTALFDIDDARGDLLKSPGYNALLRAEVPAAITLGQVRGSVTWPYIPFDADIASPVWDAMAIGVWAQFPNSRPPGTLIEATPATEGFDPSVGPVKTTLSSPTEGLRAVLVEVVSHTGGVLDIRIEAGGRSSNQSRSVAPQSTVLESFAFPGEDLPFGTPVSVEVTSPSPKGVLLVGVDESGELTAGMVAGDDEFRLARTGDVLLIERPEAAFVRLADATVVEADPQTAAEAVAAREVGDRSAVVDSDLGLASVPAQNADLEVVSLSVGRDRVDTVVRADRAAVVVISVSNYPGWSATVDGRDTEIVTADATFIGVGVPKGEHSITLRFRPSHLGISVLLAGLGIALAVGLLGIGWVCHSRGVTHSEPKPARLHAC